MKYFTFLTEPVISEARWAKRRNKALTHWRQCDTCNPALKPPKVKKPHAYFVTFTVDWKKVPDLTHIQFQAIVEKQLSRDTLYDVYYVIEHVPTKEKPKNNMHAHCLIYSWQTLSSKDKQWSFMTNNIGLVDQRIVRKNNGIDAYMSKENKPKRRLQFGAGTFLFV